MGECGRKVGLEVQSDWKIISIATVNSTAIALAAFERRRRGGYVTCGGWKRGGERRGGGAALKRLFNNMDQTYRYW